METPTVSKDDIEDVKEMALEIEKNIDKTFQDNDMSLCISALISVFLNSLFKRCSRIEEVHTFKRIINKLFDETITTFENMKNK
jgi:hypothetical protein